MLKKLVSALSGKKTYIVAIVAALVNFAVAMNWISPDHLTQINSVFAFLGLGTVRAAIKK